MNVPSQAFLTEVERSFSLTFPDTFHAFCRRYANEDPARAYPALARGTFITELATLEAINAQIGHEEWGDYERILAGKEQEKSGQRLWGGLLPFYFEPNKKKSRRRPALADQVYGFPIERPKSDEVQVWSVHTIVHGYPSLALWLADYAAKPKQRR